MIRNASTTLSTLAIIAGVGPAASGAEFSWNNWNQGSGLFGDSVHWNNPSEDMVPGVADVATFDLGGVFTVQFLEAHTTQRVLMRSGVVTFDLAAGFDYTLGSPSVFEPGVTIGAEIGDVSTLRLDGGGLGGGGMLGGYIDVGSVPGSFGAIVVTDDASLDVELSLRVGARGSGTLDMTDATVAAAQVQIAQGAGSFGDATCGAGASMTVDGLLAVGDGGFGILEIAGGADVTSAQGVIAQRESTQGAVLVSGSGSTWDVDGSIDVGMRGFGSLVIESGADVRCQGFSTVGTFPGIPPDPTNAFGELIVDGRFSSFTVEGDFLSGDLAVGYFGVGVLEVRNGAAVFVDGDLTAYDNSGAGDMEPLVFVIEDGDDWRNDFAIEAGGLAVIDGIRVELGEGYAPILDDRFRLVQALGGLEEVPTLSLETLPEPFTWGVFQTPTSLELQVVSEECTADPGPDCNGNGLSDDCDIEFGASGDCNENSIPDECEVSDGIEEDCNSNGVPDSCDIADADSDDCDGDGVPDECRYAMEDSLLLGAAGSDGARLGTSADADDGRLLVGAPGSGAGRALVYEKRDAQWIRTGMLSASDADDGDGFGAGVAISGDRLVVGAPQHAGAAGAVYAYELIDGVWVESQKLLAPQAGTDYFGSSVDVDGSWLIIGGRSGENGVGDVYQLIGSTWVFDRRFEVEDIAGGAPEWGASVAVARYFAGEPAIAIGWRSGGGFGAVQLAAYAGTWNELAVIFPPPPLRFNNPVPLALASGGIGLGSYWHLAIGAGAYADDYVLTYAFDFGDIEEIAVLQDDAPDTIFGASVAITKDRLIVGTQPEVESTDVGGAIVYRFVGLGPTGGTPFTYQVESTLIPEDAMVGDELGNAVALDGGTVIVAAIGDDTQGENAGAAYVYELDGPDCNGNGVADACDILDGTSDDLDGDGVPDECADTCPADLDASGSVGFNDLVRLLGMWGPCPNCAADLDADGSVGFNDLAQLLGQWGPCP